MILKTTNKTVKSDQHQSMCTSSKVNDKLSERVTENSRHFDPTSFNAATFNVQGNVQTSSTTTEVNWLS